MSNKKDIQALLSDLPKGFEVGIQPERLSWRAKDGSFVTEFGEILELPFQFLVVGTMYCFSAWSEQVGHPRCQSVGQCCGQYEDCSRGIRLGILVLDDFTQEQRPFFLDLYGVSEKAGNRIVRLAQTRPDLQMTRVKEIKTRKGVVFVPVADLPDEASLPERAKGDGTPII